MSWRVFWIFCAMGKYMIRGLCIIYIPIGSMYGIYANIGGIILMANVTIYIAYMDPMGILYSRYMRHTESRRHDDAARPRYGGEDMASLLWPLTCKVLST